jgi:hypothetical protein
LDTIGKEKLIKFVYILLRERLTFGDIDAVVSEVEDAGVYELHPLVQMHCEEIVNRLLKSGLKCYDSMCNTEDDDVKLVNFEGQEIPMCADCRTRNPQAVIDNH